MRERRSWYSVDRKQLGEHRRGSVGVDVIVVRECDVGDPDRAVSMLGREGQKGFPNSRREVEATYGP